MTTIRPTNRPTLPARVEVVISPRIRRMSWHACLKYYRTGTQEETS